MASRKRPASALEGADGEGGVTGSGGGEGVTLTARDRVLGMLERAPDHSLSDSALQKAIPMCTAEEIAIELQGLMRDRRVEAYAVRAPFGAPKGSVSSEHTFKLVTAEKAARLKDLEENDLMVLQYIERGGTQGVWVRNIKITTRLQQVQINKILRKLETRKLIKPVKSVAFKNRRMYMLFELEPDKALTGGPWYTDHQLDEDFVNKLRESCVILLKKFGPGNAGDVLKRMHDMDLINDVVLEKSHVEHLLKSLQADGVIDCERGGLLRLRAYGLAGRHLLPSAGVTVGAVGGVLGEGGDATQGGGDDMDEDMGGGGGGEGGGGGGGGGDAPKFTSVVRVGGRSESVVGLGGGLAARIYRTSYLSSLGPAGLHGVGPGTILDKGDRGEGGGGGGSSGSGRGWSGGAGGGGGGGEEDDGNEDEDEEGDDFGEIFAGAGKGGAVAASKRKGRGKGGKGKISYEDDEGEEEEEEYDGGEEEEEFPRYRIVRKAGGAVNGFTLTPCGVCPVLDKCTPNGVISPATCVYLTAWLL